MKCYTVSFKDESYLPIFINQMSKTNYFRISSYLLKGWGGKDLKGNRISDQENAELFFNELRYNINQRIKVMLDKVNDLIILRAEKKEG